MVRDVALLLPAGGGMCRPGPYRLDRSGALKRCAAPPVRRNVCRKARAERGEAPGRVSRAVSPICCEGSGHSRARETAVGAGANGAASSRPGNARAGVKGSPSNPAKPVRVLLAEDNAPFRRAIADFLDRRLELEVVAEAGRPAATSRPWGSTAGPAPPRRERYGLETELCEDSPCAAVLVLSATLDPTNTSRARSEGADEIPDKFATPGEIVATIKRRGYRDVA